jgi:hypothetical protein
MEKDDASASFKDVKGMPLAFAVKIADVEAPKLCTHTEAANIEWHNPHLATQESSHINSVPMAPNPF